MPETATALATASNMGTALPPEYHADVHRVLKATWGYDELRPLQAEAIAAELAGQDSLVVLPTGGGKSLCYQVPPLVAGRTDVVVSPLISLMKDQVDGLRANGYPAVALHSALSSNQKREAEEDLKSGRMRLLFVSPERLASSWLRGLLGRIGVSAFAIDEAHCISHWGHDFRAEYRRLGSLRNDFPSASLHAYTATATERVQQDIARQLGLTNEAIHVGRFDRHNLTYRVVHRDGVKRQVEGILKRHPGEAVIIYCISRAETERLAAHLEAAGYRAGCYHAGLTSEQRAEAQERFLKEDLDVIAATVAFGMGIDRSNVRCVVHVGLPQSIEHYQQETGRAGRDGLEAECVMLYSPADAMKWQGLFEKSSGESTSALEGLANQLRLLDEIRAFASPTQCRHKTLSEHFGQAYDTVPCGACDVCLGETDDLEDATVTAQKVLSCVARAGQRFGVGHIVDILRGSESERILHFRHHDLSTHGLLKEMPKKALMNIVYQLVEQKVLAREGDPYPVLALNENSWAVLRGERTVKIVPPRASKKSASKSDPASWEGVDRDLFDRLRALRTAIARERGVPPYVVFGDASLREMARDQPSSLEGMRAVYGVGEKKLEDYGLRFLEVIGAHRQG